MCSRYELNTTAREIADLFGLQFTPAIPNADVIRPTDGGLVIDMNQQAQILPWGLSVDWTKQPMINARAETLTEKPTFRGLLQSRCIVVASGYFEWRTDETGRKRKNRISRVDEPAFAMAGLIGDGRFTVVTCAADQEIEHIHGRMPAILNRETANDWLGPASFDDIAEVLRPNPGPFDIFEETPPPPAQADLFG